MRLVLDRSMRPEEAANLPGRQAGWVDTWVARYREGGLAALWNLPRPGRPARVPRLGPLAILWGEHAAHVSPASLREEIERVTGVRHHITSARRFLRAFGFSRKRPTLVHVNRAGPDGVREWQDGVIPGALRLKGRGHALLVQDESVFVNDAGRGARHWSFVGDRTCVPYTGSHGKFAAFGALADDGRQLFRTYDWFDSPTFVRYLREARRKFGRIAVVADKAPQHRAAVVKDYPEGCDGEVLLSCLPTGSPHMNASEEVWHRAKHVVRDSEYHRSVGDMRAAVGKYLRVTRHHLDMLAYLRRKAVDSCA